MKKLLIGAVTAGMLLVGATSAIAATFKTPAETYAELKGVTVEEAYTERAAGSSYGKLAVDAGVLDEFKAKMLENRKAVILDRVANGQLTQEQADTMIANIEAMQANCDETGMMQQGSSGKMGAMGQGQKGAMGQGAKSAMRAGGGTARGGNFGTQGANNAASGVTN